jgi:HK97 family phage portal protein
LAIGHYILGKGLTINQSRMSIFSSSITNFSNKKTIIPFSTIRQAGTGNMTEVKALSLSAFFGGLQQISSNVASLDGQVIKEDNSGDRTIERSHRLQNLIQYEPNAYTSSYKFHKFLILSMLLRGNGFARVERDGNLQPIALHQLKPSLVDVYTDEDHNIFYKVLGIDKFIPYWDMIHIFNFSSDGITGKSYLEAGARKQFQSHLSVQEFNRRFFDNNSFLGGILKTTDSLGSSEKIVETAKNKVREEWDKKFTGADNAGSIPILEGNWDFQEISMSMKDAQLIERSNFTVKEIARILNMPLSMMGVSNASSYNSVESDSKLYTQNVVKPILKILSEEYRAKLFTDKEKKNGYGIEINPENLEMVSLADKATAIKELILSSVMTTNEGRKRFNLDSRKDGDFLQIQKNMEVIGNEK